MHLSTRLSTPMVTTSPVGQSLAHCPEELACNQEALITRGAYTGCPWAASCLVRANQRQPHSGGWKCVLFKSTLAILYSL